MVARKLTHFISFLGKLCSLSNTFPRTDSPSPQARGEPWFSRMNLRLLPSFPGRGFSSSWSASHSCQELQRETTKCHGLRFLSGALQLSQQLVFPGQWAGASLCSTPRTNRHCPSWDNPLSLSYLFELRGIAQHQSTSSWPFLDVSFLNVHFQIIYFLVWKGGRERNIEIKEIKIPSPLVYSPTASSAKAELK